MERISGQQQANETDKAYRAFLLYNECQRDEESFLSAGDVKKNTYSRWKKQWHWDNREAPHSAAEDLRSAVKEVNQKQLSQSLEAAGSLQSFLDIINQKIEESKDEIQEMSLDQLVKLTGNLSKAMYDILNRLPQLNVEDEKKAEDKAEELRLARLIQNDEEASALASSLLVRVSEIKNSSE